MPPEPVALLVKPLAGCVSPAESVSQPAGTRPDRAAPATTDTIGQSGLAWQFSCEAWPLMVRVIWWALRDRRA